MSPGSEGARMMGCKCDQYANSFGVGDYMAPTINGGVRFVIDSACPLHGIAVWAANNWPSMPAWSGGVARMINTMQEQEAQP